MIAHEVVKRLQSNKYESVDGMRQRRPAIHRLALWLNGYPTALSRLTARLFGPSSTRDLAVHSENILGEKHPDVLVGRLALSVARARELAHGSNKASSSADLEASQLTLPSPSALPQSDAISASDPASAPVTSAPAPADARSQLLEKLEASAPSEYRCPISHEIMTDPVVTSDGHTFERRCIEEWLEKGNNTSPITNLRLDNLYLLPNLALRSVIRDYMGEAAVRLKRLEVH